MKLLKGSIREDAHRDIFWQRSFVKDDQENIILKIIVSAAQEFLSMTLKKEMIDVQIDDDMKKWFDDKTEELFEKIKLRKDLYELESLIDVYPQTEVMLQFTQTIQ